MPCVNVITINSFDRGNGYSLDMLIVEGNVSMLARAMIAINCKKTIGDLAVAS